MARSLTDTLTEAAQAAVEASDWERDQEAWNLPRGGAPGGTTALGPDDDEYDTGESTAGEQGEVSPETTE